MVVSIPGLRTLPVIPRCGAPLLDALQLLLGLRRMRVELRLALGQPLAQVLAPRIVQRERCLAEERALKVYGMSLNALQQKTGRDIGFLSVHLRHAALN